MPTSTRTPSSPQPLAAWLASVLVIQVAGHDVTAATGLWEWVGLSLGLMGLILVTFLPRGWGVRGAHGIAAVSIVAGLSLLLLYTVGGPYLALRDDRAQALSFGALALVAYAVFDHLEMGEGRDAFSVAPGFVTHLIGGIFVLLGVAALRQGDALGGIGMLLWGLAFLALGLALLRRWHHEQTAATLLWGLAVLVLGGVAILRDGDAAPGIAVLLAGGATASWTLVTTRQRPAATMAATLTSGVAATLWGLTLLRGGFSLLAAAVLLAGFACLEHAAGPLRRTGHVSPVDGLASPGAEPAPDEVQSQGAGRVEPS